MQKEKVMTVTLMRSDLLTRRYIGAYLMNMVIADWMIPVGNHFRRNRNLRRIKILCYFLNINNIYNLIGKELSMIKKSIQYSSLYRR